MSTTLDTAKWITGKSANYPKTGNVVTAKNDNSIGSRRGFALEDSKDGVVKVILDGSEEPVVVSTELAVGMNDRVFMTYDSGVYNITAFLRTRESLTKTERDLQEFETQVTESITKLQTDISDMSATTWFGDVDPTPTNYPANEWTDPSKHDGDMYYNTTSGKAFYWKDSKWQLLEDEDIRKALETASYAQDTADGKRTVFYTMTTPPPPYQIGDLWVSGATKDGDNKGELMVATATRRAGDTPQTDDWIKAVYYSDTISETEVALTNYADGIRDDLEGQIDSKIQSWYEAYDPTTTNAPASSWTTDAEKQAHTGDLFFNTTNDFCYRWSGTEWVNISGSQIAAAVADAQQALNYVEGVNTTYYQTNTPSENLVKGDLWIHSSSKILYVYTGSSWVIATKYTDDTVVEQLINSIVVTKDTSCRCYTKSYGTNVTSSWTARSTVTWWMFRPANQYSSTGRTAPTMACCSIMKSQFGNQNLRFSSNHNYNASARNDFLMAVQVPSSFPFGSGSTLPSVALDLSMDVEVYSIVDFWRGSSNYGNIIVACPETSGVPVSSMPFNVYNDYRLNIILFSRNQ